MERYTSEFQDLQWVITRAKKSFTDNPKRRVSALYRDLRKNKSFSLFGDYFILWAIAKAMKDLGMKRVRKQFWNAAKQSQEFQETPLKSQWLDTLTGDRLE